VPRAWESLEEGWGAGVDEEKRRREQEKKQRLKRKRDRLAAGEEEEDLDPRIEVRKARKEKIEHMEMEDDDDEGESSSRARSGIEPTSGWIEMAHAGSRALQAARNRPSRRQLAYKTVAPKVVVPKLSPDSVLKITSIITRKMLNRKTSTASGGAAELRQCLLAVLLARSPDEKLVKDAIDSMCEDFENNSELAAVWLNREASIPIKRCIVAKRIKPEKAEQDKENAEGNDEKEESPNFTRYENILSRFLASLLQQSNLEVAEKSIATLLSEAPVLPPTVFETLKARCDDPGTVVSGLSILKSIIVARGGTDRDTALNMIYALAVGPSNLLRGPAIRLIASELYKHPVLQGGIEDYATMALMGAPENEIEHRSHLFVALCSKNNDLLVTLARIYEVTTEFGKNHLVWHTKSLARSISRESPALLALIRGEEASDVSTPLVLAMLSSIPPEMLPQDASAPLVKAASDRFQTRGDARFMVPIISVLSKSETQQLLPKLMALSTESSAFKDAVVNLVSSTNAPLGPADIVVQLNLAVGPMGAAAKQKKITTGGASVDVAQFRASLRTCLEMKAVFNQDVITAALNELVERNPIPMPFMYTVIQSLQYQKGLQTFAVDILERLVEKEIWETSDTLWKGFVKCAETLGTKTIPILIKLPQAQLETLLRESSELNKMLKRAVENPKHKIPGYVSGTINRA